MPAVPRRRRAVPPLTMSVPEAAAALGIGVNLAYRMARSGELPVVHLGKRVLVSRARLAAMIDGAADDATAAATAPPIKSAGLATEARPAR